jgi:hypothetical protein
MWLDDTTSNHVVKATFPLAMIGSDGTYADTVPANMMPLLSAYRNNQTCSDMHGWGCYM